MTLSAQAAELLRLHRDPELLVLVNVWDAASAKIVAGLPGCRAIATASHSIAAAHGYPDGERIPLDEMITAIAQIAAAVDLPVTADLEAGYGAVRAGHAEGVPFVLNARTDAFMLAGDRDKASVLADAIERGRAFLDAGASCVFVPGPLDAATVGVLVDGIGLRKVSVIGYPGSLPQQELAALGVARVSFGPYTQRLALAALADAGAGLLAGASLPPAARAVT